MMELFTLWLQHELLSVIILSSKINQSIFLQWFKLLIDDKNNIGNFDDLQFLELLFVKSKYP